MVQRNPGDRRELEEIWRSRLEAARRRYGDAMEMCSELLGRAPDGVPSGPTSIWARAQEAKREALAEYSRMLQVFTDLAVHGKLPEEHAANESDRRR